MMRLMMLMIQRAMAVYQEDGGMGSEGDVTATATANQEDTAGVPYVH